MRASSLLGIEDAYTSYCFDEAVNYIVMMRRNKKEPVFKTKVKSLGAYYRELTQA